MRSLSVLALTAAFTLALALPCAPSSHAVELTFNAQESAPPPSGEATSAKSTTTELDVAPPGDTPVGELPPVPAQSKSAPKVEIHGGATFWYYQPFKPSSIEGAPSSNLELYQATLEITGTVGDFGIYLNPRFRDSALREFYTSNVWLEEAYAFWQKPYATIKVGKIYQQFSRLWDDTFYGNLPYTDGIKLDSNYGLSLEGAVETQNGFGVGYYVQYFLLDGRTNGSVRGRDTVWVDGGVHRNHTTVLRVEPSYRINDKASLRLGLAGEYTYVDFTTTKPTNVFRFSGDMSFAYSPVRVFAEFIAQSGQTVTEYPIEPKPAGLTGPAVPGRASLHNHYVLTGAEVQIGPVLARYAFSMARYRDIPVTELMNVPGVTVTVHDNISLQVEYAYWNRQDPGGKTTIYDNSLNVLVNGTF